MTSRRHLLALFATATLAGAMPAALSAQAQYDTGATDAEIRIGNTAPYSGPASSFGVVGLAMQAVFARANAEGGVNGRQITLISYDDAYNPATTLEQTRRLVEHDGVLFVAASVGSAHNIAIQRYLNQREIPHLLVMAGGARWNDPENYPWTVSGLISPYELEGFAFGQHALAENPTARIGVLFQNDDLGREYLAGLERALDGTEGSIVRQESFEVMDPSVEAQIVSLQASGAEVLMMFSGPRATAQAIRKAADLGWQPARYLGSVGSVIQTSLVPAGLDISTGIITTLTSVDPDSAAFQATPEYATYIETLQQYYPDAAPTNGSIMLGYNTAHALLQILERAGDTLTRENILAVATDMPELHVPLMMPDIPLATNPDNYQLVRGVHMARFNGTAYEIFGDLVTY